MNSNWPRWIFASVSKHFDLNTGDLTLFIEGQKRGDKYEEADLIEFRMDGPSVVEISKDYWRAYIEVNILVQSALNDTNMHRIHEMVGIVALAFTGIPIYKYGSGVGDDDSIIGCFELLQDRDARELLVISHFGRIDPDKLMLQATVEGHYEVHLTG